MASTQWGDISGGDWTAAGNWTGGTPTSVTDATIGIAGTYVVSLTTSGAAASLTIDDASATLSIFTIGGGSAASLTVQGDLVNSGTLDVDSAVGQGGSSLTISGTLVNSGAINIGNGALESFTSVTAGGLDNTGAIQVSADAGPAVLDITAAAPDVLSGGLNLNSEFNGVGALVEFASGAISSIASGGQLLLNGIGTFVADAGNTGSESALALTSNQGNLILWDGVTLATPGDFDNGGLLNVGQFGGATLTVPGMLTNSGTIEIFASFNTATVSAATLANTGSITIGNGGSGTSLLAITGNGSDTGSIVVASGALLSAGSRLTVSSGGTVTVSSSGGADNLIVVSGGSEVVESGGVSSDTTVGIGATETVSSGGTAIGTTVSGGGAQLSVVGSASGTILLSGGQQFVVDGAVASGTTINADSFDTVLSGGSEFGATVEGSGAAIYDFGSASGTIINSGGDLEVFSGGRGDGATVNSDGRQDVGAGGVGSGTTVESGGYERADGTEIGAAIHGGLLDVFGTASGVTIDSGGQGNAQIGGLVLSAVLNGGTLAVFGSASGTVVNADGSATITDTGSALGIVVNSGGRESVQAGGTTVDTSISGGTVEVGIGAIVSNGIDFGSAAGGELQIDGTASPNYTVSGFVSGDTFNLPDLSFSSSGTADLGPGNLLHIHEGSTQIDIQLDPGQDFSGDFFHPQAAGGGTLVSEDNNPCFCRGTLIRTDRGEVPVERLAIGQMVMTASGTARPIKWIGRRAYNPRFVAGNRKVMPIRIEAGALADGMPRRDLWLSPEHALSLHGVLVPAALLVNGATIAQATRVDRLEYFHIELDTPDVMFAEGAAAESYVDCDNRGMFQNWHEFGALYPRNRAARWQFAASRVEEGAPELRNIRRALLARAERAGRISRDPDLHLIVDGTALRAQISVNCRFYRFAVPPDFRMLSLASRRTVPAGVGLSPDDHRSLGVAIERIVLRSPDGRSVEIAHNSPALRDGFHADEGAHRWSDGHGHLPATLLAPVSRGGGMEVHLGETAIHYVVRAAPPPAGQGGLALTPRPAALHAMARRR
jgi:autotransporter passenger strand-loop-strand repeat protein